MSNGSVNHVTILGRLGDDPKLTDLPEGGKVANFSVATSESWNDRDSGQKQERVTWHKCAAFRELAEVIAKHLHKGSRVHIDGRLQNREWTDRNNSKHVSTEIIVADVTFLDPPKAAPQEAAPRSSGRPAPRASKAAGNQPRPAA
jgi:single-strand DNA-binding protein